MVKKISSSKPPQPLGKNITRVDTPVSPSALDSTKAIQTNQTKGVGSIKTTQQTIGAGRVRKATRPLTAAEREHIFQLIDEEAKKLFGQKGLPESKKTTITNAVKMAIDAGIVDEAEEGTASGFEGVDKGK